jgi:hypothetical protein
MKLVQWTDGDGYLHHSLLMESDPDSQAENGIPLDPPSPAGFDIPAEVKRDLHNELSARGLLTWADVLAQQNGVTGVVRSISSKYNLSDEQARSLKRRLIAEYRR